eukprot:6495616-Pyramimonas_sp.AAC.1
MPLQSDGVGEVEARRTKPQVKLRIDVGALPHGSARCPAHAKVSDVRLWRASRISKRRRPHMNERRIVAIAAWSPPKVCM